MGGPSLRPGEGGDRAESSVLESADVEYQMHAYGTNIEGDYDVVMAAIKACHEAVHAMGAPRISTTIKLGTRVDRAQTMADKIQSVEEKLDENG